MKATGITRPVDPLGRVVIPVELRRSLGIKTDDLMEIYLDGGKIVLQKCEPKCVFCGSEENVVSVQGKSVCRSCLDEMKKL